MEQTNTRNHNAEALQRQPDEQSSLVHRRRWPTVLVAGTLIAAAGGGFWSILWASEAFADIGVAVNFVVVNTLSLLVLLAIIAQACIYWAQRGIMKQQWIAMQDALKQAQEQTRIAGDSLVIGTRSYVGVHSIGFEGQGSTIFMKIENIGHVPADGIELMMELATSMAPSENVRDLTRHRISRNYGGMQLFPGNLKITEAIYLGTYLTKPEIDLIIRGEGNLVIRGHLNYKDGFGSQKTEFFFMYDAYHHVWSADAPEGWADLLEKVPITEKKKSKEAN